MTGFGGALVRVLQGAVVAQAIGFAALPILARQYGPEAFGHFQLYQMISAFLLLLASMRYEVALLRAETEREYAAVLRLCLLCCAGMTVVTALVCIAIAMCLELRPELRQLLWLLPLVTLFGGALQIMTYVVLRNEAFGIGAGAKVAQAVGYSGAGLAIGALSPFGLGLVIADILGRLLSFATFALHRPSVGRVLDGEVRRSEVFSAARRYREFPLISLPGGLVNTAGGTITSAMLYGYFDSHVSGQYGLVERSLLLPLGMLAGAIAQVYTARLASSLRAGKEEVVRTFRRLLGLLLATGVIPALVLGITAPELFVWTFGNQWRVAGEFAQIMSPMLLTTYLMAPVNMVLVVLGKQITQSVWEACRLAALLLAWMTITGLDYTPKEAIVLHTVASVVMMVAYILIADASIRRHRLTTAAGATVA